MWCLPCRERRCKRPEAPTRATGIVIPQPAVATRIWFDPALRSPAVIIACSKMFKSVITFVWDPLVLADCATGLTFETLSSYDPAALHIQVRVGLWRIWRRSINKSD